MKLPEDHQKTPASCRLRHRDSSFCDRLKHYSTSVWSSSMVSTTNIDAGAPNLEGHVIKREESKDTAFFCVFLKPNRRCTSRLSEPWNQRNPRFSTFRTPSAVVLVRNTSCCYSGPFWDEKLLDSMPSAFGDSLGLRTTRYSVPHCT